MQNELTFPLERLYSFLLVLTRISGVFLFVPFPGLRHGQEAAKIAFSLIVTLSLAPFWPPPPAAAPGLFRVAGWIFSEALLGITLGLAIAFLLEAFALAAQILGLQAGYSYSSTIDPQSQADATVLQVIVQIFAGLLFFAIGADREVIRAFAATFEAVPLGVFVPGAETAGIIQKLGSEMFATGLRVAMPLIAILLLVDLSLALFSRLNNQLQLTTIAFPAKMSIALFALASLAAGVPAVFERSAAQTFRAIHHLGR